MGRFQLVEKANLPHNAGAMKFQKAACLRSLTCAVSAKHTPCCKTTRSMLSGNFEIFLNNSLLVNLYIQAEIAPVLKDAGRFMFTVHSSRLLILVHYFYKLQDDFTVCGAQIVDLISDFVRGQFGALVFNAEKQIIRRCVKHAAQLNDKLQTWRGASPFPDWRYICSLHQSFRIPGIALDPLCGGILKFARRPP